MYETDTQVHTGANHLYNVWFLCLLVAAQLRSLFQLFVLQCVPKFALFCKGLCPNVVVLMRPLS
jgi:hypothetical protein